MRGEIDDDVAQFRPQTLFKIMRHNVVHGKRVKVQVLAFGIKPGSGYSPEHSYIQKCRITADTVVPEDGLLLEPIAVRAPSAHTFSNNWYDVKLRTKFLSHKLTPGAVTMMPSSFHVTSRENLFGIFEEGTVPGGGSGRVVTRSSMHSPHQIQGHGSWQKDDTSMEKRQLSTCQPNSLSRRWQYPKIRGAWVQDSDSKWPQTDCTSRSWATHSRGPPILAYAGRDQVLKEARICAESVDRLDAEAAEIIDIVTAFENKMIRLGEKMRR